MATNNSKNTSKSSDQTRIAQIVSSYTEPLGISERRKLEEITNEAIRRIEGILPGMEGLIKPSDKQPLSDNQIIGVIKEIINEKAKMEKTILESTISPEKKEEASKKTAPKTNTKIMPKIQLSENAIVVLEKR